MALGIGILIILVGFNQAAPLQSPPTERIILCPCNPQPYVHLSELYHQVQDNKSEVAGGRIIVKRDVDNYSNDFTPSPQPDNAI